MNFHLCVPGIPGDNAVSTLLDTLAEEHSFAPPARVYQIGVPRRRLYLGAGPSATMKFATGLFKTIIDRTLPVTTSAAERPKAFIDFESKTKDGSMSWLTALYGTDDEARKACVAQLRILMMVARQHAPDFDLMFYECPRTPGLGAYPDWMSEGHMQANDTRFGGNDRIVELGLYQDANGYLVQAYNMHKDEEAAGHFGEDGYASKQKLEDRIVGTIGEARRVRDRAKVGGPILAAVSPIHYIRPWKNTIVGDDDMDLTYKATCKVKPDGVMLWLQREWGEIPALRAKLERWAERYPQWFGLEPATEEATT